MPLLLRLKVVPGASSDSLEWHGDRLKVRVRAAPENGQANTAVAKLLSARLNTGVRIVAGFGSPLKTAEIADLDLAEVKERLAS